MNTTTAVDSRLARLRKRLADIKAQGGTGEIINTPGLPPFILYTMAADPTQAATNFFTN